MQQITVLGATGSIGQNTLQVIKQHPDKYQVYGISAHKNLQQLVILAKQYSAKYVVAADINDFDKLQTLAKENKINAEVLAGPDALIEIASNSNVDQVMSAIVGAAGLLPTMAATQAGKRVLLANKESLVMSGELLIQAANKSGAKILPVDSEHNAIFQCLPNDYSYGDLKSSGISKLLLTGSGGPFLQKEISSLGHVTPEEACNHPNWSMGQKISVDSATMMNKGLEFIEACRLFGVTSRDIEVIIHPQSIVHSMVQYCDGSVVAQMGQPDMRTPIAYCLSYPDRVAVNVAPLDFTKVSDFSFMSPDFLRYPNLKLAIEACDAGQYATTTINGSNEVAVEAFLRGQITFTDIYRVNNDVLDDVVSHNVSSIEEVLACDKQARSLALQHVKRLN